MAEIRPDPNNPDDGTTREAVTKRFWRAIDRIQARNVDADTDEEMKHISRTVDEARQERHDAARRNSKSSR
jgi:hypothetical protein